MLSKLQKKHTNTIDFDYSGFKEKSWTVTGTMAVLDI